MGCLIMCMVKVPVTPEGAAAVGTTPAIKGEMCLCSSNLRDEVSVSFSVFCLSVSAPKLTWLVVSVKLDYAGEGLQ
jgi:hypothetical protein